MADEEGKYNDLGLDTLADSIPDTGPLGGLQTALAHAQGQAWILAVSCDWYGLKPEWVETLAKRLKSDCKAVIYRDDRWQPFPGLYQTNLAALTETRISQKKLSMQGLLDAAEALSVPLPSDWGDARQINRKDDLPNPGSISS